jgi:formate dehydrogenase major subunit
MTILIHGSVHNAMEGERLIDVVLRSAVKLPHVCYHPQLGPIQTCDTCMVDVGGKLVRACATPEALRGRQRDLPRVLESAPNLRSLALCTLLWPSVCPGRNDRRREHGLQPSAHPTSRRYASGSEDRAHVTWA